MDAIILYRNRFRICVDERSGYDGPVLVKEPDHAEPRPTLIAELYNEYAVTEQLADVHGVRRALAMDGSAEHPALILEYIQGQTLDEIAATAIDLTAKLEIACGLAAILAQIHERQITHREICSDNILVAEDCVPGAFEGLYLLDFGLATKVRKEGEPRIGVSSAQSRSLAYISPEQTGRIGRLVDYRTDLYSLGVVLYELFTGELPFRTDDALEMIHNHIARLPAAPHDIDAVIPLPASAIVLKLLTKNADDRYQTARGLHADLMYCLDQQRGSGQVAPFALAQDDLVGRLQFPQKLFGRQAEIDQLLETCDRVAKGKAELLLVTGYAGVGKTALVDEIRAPLLGMRGTFIEGKFEQHQRDAPYAAWLQAFSELVNYMLTDDEIRLNRWRANILDAIGQNGQVLVDLIPTLEFVIGPQPDVLELDGREAENRLSFLFQRFVSAIATQDHPLVIFLDDLQWIDLASLNLLTRVLVDQTVENLLLIGAYRSNEVDNAHPLLLKLEDIKEAGATVTQLAIDDLDLVQVNDLVADSLPMPPSHCLPLSKLVHANTNGNVFFTRQLLQSLEEEGQLRFDRDDRTWQWDMKKLRNLTLSDNVVDLMIRKMDRLPGTTQNMLRLAACLGNRFELTVLGQICEQPPEELDEHLNVAYRDGLLERLGSSSRFAHDRIQQAAYSVISESERSRLHRQIGWTLLRTAPHAEGKDLFDIVGHLNRSIPLIESEAERVEVAVLNLKAAQAGRRSSASAATEACALEAINLLGGRGWQDHYPMMLVLHQLLAEAAYLGQKLERSQHYADITLANARSLLERVPLVITKIRVYHARNQMDRAMDTGLEALRELGFAAKESAPPGLTVEAIADLPIMSDPAAIAAMELLENLAMTAYVAHFQRFPSVIYTALHLMLKFGAHPASSTIVVWYGMLIWREDIGAAHQFGDSSMQLVERLDAKRYLGSVKIAFTSLILPWKTHIRSLDPELRSGFISCFEVGERVLAAGALTFCSYYACMAGRPLAQVHKELVKNIELQQRTGEAFTRFNIRIWAQYVANLRGLTDNPLEQEGPFYSQARELPAAQATKLFAPIAFTHCIRLALHYHWGQPSVAYESSLEVEPFEPHLTAHVIYAFFIFYQSLTILQLPDGQVQHADLDEKLKANVAKLRLWAEHAPMNYQHKLDLVLAEQARVRGDVARAIGHYEAAIDGARENSFLNEEAMANELFGRFWTQRGTEAIAELYIGQAHALYARWGAVAIVEHLEAQYPQWLRGDLGDPRRHQSTDTIGELPPNIDHQSILQASQAIAAEIQLEKLLSRLMVIVMENAGAQRGYLMLEEEGRWTIDAAVDVGQAKPQLMQNESVDENTLISRGIVHYVARTRQAVVLADAAGEGMFTHDPYIQRERTKSLLCLPIVNQDRVNAILYLENNLISHAFNKERVELLRLLSAQMAVSIDHARLYSQLEVAERERSEALDVAQGQVRDLFENTPVGVCLTNRRGNILAANSAMLRITGYDESELLQISVLNLYEDPLQRAKLLQKIEEERSVRDFSVRLLQRDGTTFFARLYASVIQREGQEVLLAMVEDVTSEVLANAALNKANTDLVTLLNGSRSITAALDLDNLFEAVLAHLGPVVDSAIISVWTREEDDLVLRAFRAREPRESRLDFQISIPAISIERRMMATGDACIEDDICSAEDIPEDIEELMVAFDAQLEFGAGASWLRVPLIAREQMIGVISLLHDEPEHYTQTTADWVQAIANQTTIAIENIRFHQEAREKATQDERDRLARELHDSVTQMLFSTTLFAQAGLDEIEAGDAGTAAYYFTRIGEATHQSLKEMRLLIYELLPTQLDRAGLVNAIQLRLEIVEKRAGIDAQIRSNELGYLQESEVKALYRISQEALNNSLKHAQANKVTISIHRHGEEIQLEIVDDGIGFEPETVGSGGLGLQTMRERAQRLGGEFFIDSVQEEGTKISVILRCSDD